MIKKKIKFFVLLLSLSCDNFEKPKEVVSFQKKTKETNKVEQEELKLGFALNEIRPFYYLEKGKITGVFSEDLKNFFKKNNIKLNINKKTNIFLEKNTSFFKDTLIAPLFYDDSEKDKFIWIGPVGKKISFYIYKHKKTKFDNIKSLSQITKKKAGVLEDSLILDFLDEKGFRNVHKFSSDRELLKSFFEEKIEVIISNGKVLKKSCEAYNYDFYDIIQANYLKSFIPYLAFVKGSNKTLVDKVKMKYDKNFQK